MSDKNDIDAMVAMQTQIAELRAENEKLKTKIEALETEANRCAFCDKPGVIEHREKMYCQYHYEHGGD